jgi:hypothetical protein
LHVRINESIWRTGTDDDRSYPAIFRVFGPKHDIPDGKICLKRININGKICAVNTSMMKAKEAEAALTKDTTSALK